MFQTLDVSDAQAPRPSPSSPPAMFPSRQLKLFFYRPSFPSTSSAAIIPKSNPFVFCEGSPFFGTTEPLRPLAQILRISTLKVAPWRFHNFSADRNNHVVNVIFLLTFSQAYSSCRRVLLRGGRRRGDFRGGAARLIEICSTSIMLRRKQKKRISTNAKGVRVKRSNPLRLFIYLQPISESEDFFFTAGRGRCRRRRPRPVFRRRARRSR